MLLFLNACAPYQQPIIRLAEHIAAMKSHGGDSYRYDNRSFPYNSNYYYAAYYHHNHIDRHGG
jgi:hypothetical protein